MKDLFFYYFIRFITFPLSFFPYRLIHSIGKFLGLLCYYFLKDFRKRTLSNLALAKDLNLSFKEIKKIAKQSFQNLAINILEYPKFAREKHFNKIIKCENPEEANALFEKKQGIIFFCGHQSNWEVLFLDGNCHMKGIAIGKSIKNKRLYRWIVSIREKNGGKIVSTRNAIKEGLRALRKGIFMGIVGDQGMPESTYSFPFLGRRAWTSSSPALLSYKTNSPIIVATTRRKSGKYYINYSKPIWPNLENPLEKEVTILMDKSLGLFQQSIYKSPGEWLWQHNRWKQQTPSSIYKRFRKDSIAIILPFEKEKYDLILKHLPALQEIYNKAFLFIFAPKIFSPFSIINGENEIIYYNDPKELFIKDLRFKLVYNFTSITKLKKHFLKLSAFDVFQLQDLIDLAKDKLSKNDLNNFSKIFQTVICREKNLIS